jgi:hypothetical protein
LLQKCQVLVELLDEALRGVEGEAIHLKLKLMNQSRLLGNGPDYQVLIHELGGGSFDGLQLLGSDQVAREVEDKN